MTPVDASIAAAPPGGATNVAVESDDDGARLDRWFRRHFPALAHGALEKLLRTGQVRLDGKRAKAGERISTGQIIRLPPQVQSIHEVVDARSTDPQPVPAQASERARIFAESLVIHKDSAVLVLNKPSGLASQGGRHQLDNAGTAIALDLGTTVNGLAGDSNTLASLVVSTIPVGAILSDDQGNTFTATDGSTSVDVHGWDLAHLTITPTDAANFTLNVAATAQEWSCNSSPWAKSRRAGSA